MVESVFDELHGLRIFINGYDGKWPSTIKFAQPRLSRCNRSVHISGK